MRLAVRNLLRRPRRTLLTVAGLALGAMSYMVLVGATQGFLQQYTEVARFCGADLVVHQASATSPWSSGVLPAQVTALRGVPGVTRVARLGLGKAQLFGSSYFLVFGVDPGEALAARLQLVRGHPLRRGVSEILLGELAARSLQISVGQEVEIRRVRFTVAAIYRTGNTMIDAGAVLDLHSVQALFNLGDNVNLVFLELASPARRAEALAAIAANLPDLEARPWESWTLAFGQATLVEAFARLLALLAVLIAALGASNVMHIAVSERTQELAVLRAIGWRRARVAGLVLQEGAGLSLLGGLCGMPLAAAVFWLAGSLGFLTLRTGGLIPLRLPLSAAIEGAAVTLLTGVVGALPPLLRALRIHPAHALNVAA